MEVGLTPPDRKHVLKFFLRPTFECDPYGSCEMFEGIMHATILRARIRCISFYFIRSLKIKTMSIHVIVIVQKIAIILISRN